MKLGEKKPYIPIFVGSTFTDMQLYRRAVREALAQLETIVRGMEQFGSKPGGPVDECLRIVSSCDVYVGLFGMRYGTVPEGHEKSMTHLEYDEAQRCKLPSLIYIIDEENQPVLPKDIEFGPGADKLALLKAELKKRHVVSFFTTPEDLRARILHDVPDLLRNIGAEVSGELLFDSAQSDADVLRSFEMCAVQDATGISFCIRRSVLGAWARDRGHRGGQATSEQWWFDANFCGTEHSSQALPST